MLLLTVLIILAVTVNQTHSNSVKISKHTFGLASKCVAHLTFSRQINLAIIDRGLRDKFMFCNCSLSFKTYLFSFFCSQKLATLKRLFASINHND